MGRNSDFTEVTELSENDVLTGYESPGGSAGLNRRYGTTWLTSLRDWILSTLGSAANADTSDFDAAGTGASEAASAVGAHAAASDPHGDRAFATAAIGTHAAASDPHGDRAYTDTNKAPKGAATGSGLTMATARLLGRTTAGSGAVEEISVSGATLSGGVLTITGGSSTVLNSINDGRLTLESGVPNSVSNQAAKSTIYYTPYCGNRIALYDGAAWEVKTFSELSFALSGLTSGKNYDLYAWNNAGTVTLAIGTAWASDTARVSGSAGEVELVDGVHVNKYTEGSIPAQHGRLVGTFRTSGTTTTEDVMGGDGVQPKRYLSNLNHHLIRPLWAADTGSHTYASAAARKWQGSDNYKAEFVNCMPQNVSGVVSCNLTSQYHTQYFLLSLGLDTETTPPTWVYSYGLYSTYYIATMPVAISYGVGAGFHYACCIEYSASAHATSVSYMHLTINWHG